MDMTGLYSASSLAGEAVPLTDGSTRNKPDAVMCSNGKVEKIKDIVHIQQPPEKSETKTNSQSGSIRSGSTNQYFDSSKSEELREALLRTDEIQEVYGQSRGESPKTSTSSGENLILDQASIQSLSSEEETKQKRMSSRRARMMDLGKKIGEKLEEKRCQIVERGRHVVEKMGENERT